jgi:CheY-like chemotaxis protein
LIAPGSLAAPKRVVLYVEDNPFNIMLMEALFETLPGATLHIARNSTEGLSSAQALGPDLLLLDINLPDFSGTELLARIRQNAALADVPAIAVSADAMPEHIQHALDSGFREYWTKPFEVEQKREALAEMLTSKH